MKREWLKTNWFKGGLLSICLVALIAIVFREEQGKPHTKKADLELQAMCAKRADEVFKEEYPKTQGEMYGYTCHYNRKLNKCFMLVGGALLGGQTSNVSSLYDAYEGKMYAEYHQIVKEGQHYYDTRPFICTMLDNSCNSREEYDNFVKPYMEE